ncbi:BnaA09g48140D [Brassica napus]|uniref:BnaA09g48140D protein n=1 Tax=Brassica napus TaxID=3708 RepID=A0A078HDH8_BRANA|nr:BnaA09g48140D [Brassica napus]
MDYKLAMRTLLLLLHAHVHGSYKLGLWKYRANILNRWQNYRKYVSFITIFPPEEFSAEMEMVARGLEKLMKLEERQSLMRTFRVLGPHNVSVNEDLREAAKQVEVLASVQTYVLVFVTMYGRINHSHSIEFHPELLEQFAIGGKEADALEKSKISSSGGSSLHQYRDYQIF